MFICLIWLRVRLRSFSFLIFFLFDFILKYLKILTIISRLNTNLETKIVEVSSDEGTLYPLGGVRIVVRVLYSFTRGTA